MRVVVVIGLVLATTAALLSQSTYEKLSQSTEKLLRDIYGDAKIAQPWTLPQEHGDSATGVVLREEDDKSKLYLDSKPCDGKVMTFSKPYRKVSAGSVKCKGHELPLYSIQQQ